MSTRTHDRYGVEVEAADETAVQLLDEAVHTLVALDGDPVAAISVAADSGLVLARCLLAYLHCSSGSRRGYALARDVLDGTPDPSAPRERAQDRAGPVRHPRRSGDPARRRRPGAPGLAGGQPGSRSRGRDVRLRPGGVRRLPGGRTLRPRRPRGQRARRLGGARDPERVRDGGAAGRWAGVRRGDRAGLGGQLLRGAQLVALGAVPPGAR